MRWLRVLGSVLIAAFIATGAFAQTRDFNIPAGELKAVLDAFVQQSGAQLVYRADEVVGVQSKGVTGSVSREEALARILEGTGFAGHRDSSGAFAVVREREQSRTEKPGATSSAIKGEKIEITGSRLSRNQTDGPQEVKVYKREYIEQSGQATVADFLNSLPEVSVLSSESAVAFTGAISTVRLRGFPVGTTLVLLNGRRLNNSGFAFFRGEGFDLNFIPLNAIERVEVSPVGGSAVYGSDAMAGVVNIILKKDFDGSEVRTSYGFASGLEETTLSAAFGKRFDRGQITAIVSHSHRTDLSASERDITSTRDFRRFGGNDARVSYCDPGTVRSLTSANLPGLSSPLAAIPIAGPRFPSISDFAATAGQARHCDANFYSLVPASNRTSGVVSGSLDLTADIQVFAELLLAKNTQYSGYFPAGIRGPFTVPASNAFNPFGRSVSVSNQLYLGRPMFHYDSTLTRPVIGLKGTLAQGWDWEVSSTYTRDDDHETDINTRLDPTALSNALGSSNPDTALNLFASGPPASQAVLDSLRATPRTDFGGKSTQVSGVLRGRLFSLPTGDVESVLGGEYARGDVHAFFGSGTSSFKRDMKALFGELKVPILGSRDRSVLSATFAARNDTYSDFGGRTVPQVAAEWRPTTNFLGRATYGRTFRAPQLFQLNFPAISFATPITDPSRNETYTAQINTVGNPNLKPETGESTTVGFVYSNRSLSNLNLSATAWALSLDKFVQIINFGTVLANENLFPEGVIREAGSGGQPGRVISIAQAFYNFGKLDLRGADLSADMSFRNDMGQFTPSLSATYVYKYTGQLTPRSAPTDRVSRASTDFLWSPRWKATAALNWKARELAVNVAGRYTSGYFDYGSTTRRLGDFWYLDASIRYDLAKVVSPFISEKSRPYVSVSVVNALDKQPPYSSLFGTNGYDLLQYDIRGRFISVQVGGAF